MSVTFITSVIGHVRFTGVPSLHVVLAIRDCLVAAGWVEFDDSNNKSVVLLRHAYVRLDGRRLARVSAGRA